MSVDTAVGAASQICGFVAPPILQQFGYIFFCERNAAELKELVVKLKNAKARLQHRIDESTSAGEVIEDDVLTWLDNADELIKSSTLILETNKVRWYLGFIPGPRDGYRLGRNAKKSIPDLESAYLERNFEKISYRPSLRIGASVSSSRHIVALKSQGLVFESVMEALNDDNVRAIGVYGMGGVGKTTLLKKVENQAKELSKFDGVTSVFVSQIPDMAMIRAAVKNGIGLPGETRKTILLLLDDLWNGVTWNNFEVPENSDKVKVRLVMTSRNQHLLIDEMRCEKTFSMGVLDEEEGWKFFAELVGSPVEVLQKSSTASVLLKKCAGLPVSIEALSTLWKKKKTKYSSSNDLSVDELIHEKESQDGSASIELSYNNLLDSEEKQAKLLFRTIGLLGTPKVPVMTLLKYGVGSGLFGNSDSGNIMERARREITRSLRTLQDSSLLLESDDNNHVKIHDVVRDVAVRIASTHDHALILNADAGVMGWSRDKLKKCTAMSLCYNAVSELHGRWNCPNLNTLIMEAAGDKQGDNDEFPNSFFNGMTKLKVIDLRKVRLTSMQSFLQSNLRHVTTLCLDYCYLENVAGIGKLESLQVLSFVGSEIAELPEEIGGLTKLRLLDLSKCLKLGLIKPGVLERLTRLEELYLRESFDSWEIEEDGRQQSNSSLAELNNLPQLRTLEARVPDTSKLPPSLPLGGLVQYKVLIGDAWDWPGEYRESRTLKLKVKSNNIMTQEWLQSALQKTQDLHLDGLCGTNESFHEVCREGFKELKHLHLQNSSSIRCIIWSSKWLFCSAFTILESMNLEKLESLEKICHGIIDSTSFSQLKIVKVKMCDKLRNLFSLSLVKSLTKLEEIEVSDCKLVQEIFIAEKADDDDDDGTDEDNKKVMTCCSIKRSKVPETRTDVAEGSWEATEILSNIRCLTLRNLPQLTAFFTKEAPSGDGDSMDTTLPAFFSDQQIREPSKIKQIPSIPHLAPGLGNLRRVEVVDCARIVNFVNSRMLLKLVNLESLTIARCESLKVIFDLGEIDARHGNVEILPKLYELKLSELPELVHIWKKNFKQIEGCRKLRTLEIHHCENLPYLSSSSMCKGMENLTEINILHCKNLETIFLEEDGPTKDASAVIQLTSLKILGISNCSNLKAFLSGNYHATPSSGSSTFNCTSKGMACWCCGKQDMAPADTSTTFFSDKVSLPSLESLVISSSGKFEKLWYCELPSDKSFYKLEFVNVEGCDTLSVVFPATLIERLQNLKHLSIQRCMGLRTVIDLDVDWKTNKKPKVLILSRLQEVKLDSLENLSYIMKRDSTIVVGFPSLKQLAVWGCGKLEQLISFATATTLLKLEKLSIHRCTGLSEVIYHEEVTDVYKRNAITFPYLTSLSLESLDNLTYFSSESCLFSFMCLKSLEIEKCQSLKTLVKPTSDGHSGSEAEEDQANTGRQALFSDKVNIPNLVELVLVHIEVEELWCSEAPMDSFCKLKLLKVDCCSRLRNIIPSFLIKRLQNLEYMRIWGCESLDDVFEIPSDQQVQATQRIIKLAKLTSLELGKDVKLRNLHSGGYALQLVSLKTLSFVGEVVATIIEKAYLPNLERLQVYNSASAVMTELWGNEPHVGSFCKLRHLQVEVCGELKKLIPSFMLKRLQNLEELVVTKCEKLETVVELGGGLIDAQKIESKLFCFPLQKLTSIHVKKCEDLLNLFTASYYGETTSKVCDGFVVPRLTKLRLEELPKFIHLFQVQQEVQCTLELPSLREFFLINDSAGAKEAITHKVIFPKEVEIRERDITFFGSATTVLMDIMKALRQTTDQNIQIIGALGWMPSLDERLKGLIKEQGELFDQVVYLSGHNAEYIQEKLGKALNIIYGTVVFQKRAERLRNSLLSDRNKRLLLVISALREEVDLEAAGIPRDGLFKQILVSEKREVLVKMGAQQVIDIGHSIDLRWQIIEQELCDSERQQQQYRFLRDSKKQQLQDLQDDTLNTNIEDVSFLAEFGSKTSVMNNIIKALQNNNNQIIGLLGREDKSSYSKLFVELAHLVRFNVIERSKRQANMFDDVVDLDGNSFHPYSQRKKVTFSEVHKRAQESLLNNKEKRMLLMILLDDLDQEMHGLQVIGVPHDEVDPKFKIILFSQNREVLEKLGAQQVIDISSVSAEVHFRYHQLLDGYVDWSEFEKLGDECGCDELTKHLAKKLKGQGLREWAKAIRCLKDSPYEYEARKRVIDSLQGRTGHKHYRKPGFKRR